MALAGAPSSCGTAPGGVVRPVGSGHQRAAKRRAGALADIRFVELAAFHLLAPRSYRHAPKPFQRRIDQPAEGFRSDGQMNFLFLAAIIGAVFPPAKYFLREIADVLRTMPGDAALMVALSLGGAFFGAMTYIGNGPDLMVQSIANGAAARTPSFFGGVFQYSVPILRPITTLDGCLFL